MLFYNFFIYVFYLLIKISAISGNKKSRLWINGRKGWLENLRSIPVSGKKRVWFHCASLGEFEQARPVIERLKSIEDIEIWISFFSPSGYEIRKNYPFASHVFYLPADTRKNSKELVAIINPSKVYFIKYEFWFNLMNELYLSKIPFYYISAIFRPQQYFFSAYGNWVVKHLRNVTHFFVQNEESRLLLSKIEINNVTVTGDTRFERVASIMEQDFESEKLKKFSEDSFVMICGSTWPDDLNIIFKAWENDLYLKNKFKMVIAPHEIKKDEIVFLKDFFNTLGGAVLYSDDCIDFSSRVMVIDSIGILSMAYKYGNIAYIGGGFGKGIHNVLEPAAAGLPVLCGPGINKFSESIYLLKSKGLFVVKNYSEVKNIVSWFMDDSDLLSETGKLNMEYIKNNSGATALILGHPDHKS